MKNLQALFDIFNDGISKSVKTISYPHHEIHDGRGFIVVYSALKDNAGAIEVRIRPNHATRKCHMVIHIEAALAATIQLWSETTKTYVLANNIEPVNRNFSNAKDSILSVCHTPAGVQAGTADFIQYIGSATANGKSDIGGGTTSRGEFILNPFTDYLITVTSRANSNALTILLDWYEHIDN